jgi:hypothetical protein
MHFHNFWQKRNYWRSFCFILTVVVFLTHASFIAWAAQAGGGTSVTQISGDITNPLAQNDVISFILALTTQLTRVGLIIAAVFIIYSGFLFVSARGSEDGIKRAKNAFFYTVLGTAILLGAGVIVEIVKATIGALG